MALVSDAFILIRTLNSEVLQMQNLFPEEKRLWKSKRYQMTLTLQITLSTVHVNGYAPILHSFFVADFSLAWFCSVRFNMNPN